MADPPSGPPKPLATTSSQRLAAIDASESLEPTVVHRTRRQTRAAEDLAHTGEPIIEPTNAGGTSGRGVHQRDPADHRATATHHQQANRADPSHRNRVKGSESQPKEEEL